MSFRNVGLLDRGLRLLLGVAMLGFYGALDAPWKYFTLLGLVLVATGLSGFCPLYRLAGASTCRNPEPKGS